MPSKNPIKINTVVFPNRKDFLNSLIYQFERHAKRKPNDQELGNMISALSNLPIKN